MGHCGFFFNVLLIQIYVCYGPLHSTYFIDRVLFIRRKLLILAEKKYLCKIKMGTINRWLVTGLFFHMSATFFCRVSKKDRIFQIKKCPLLENDDRQTVGSYTSKNIQLLARECLLRKPCIWETRYYKPWVPRELEGEEVNRKF